MIKRYSDPTLERLQAKRINKARLTAEKTEKGVNSFLIALALIFIFLGGMYMDFFYKDLPTLIRATPKYEQERNN